MKVGVVGASGYAGVELLRLCAVHPDLEVAVATAGEHRGDVGGRSHAVAGRRLPRSVVLGHRGVRAGRPGSGLLGPAPWPVPAPGARADVLGRRHRRPGRRLPSGPRPRSTRPGTGRSTRHRNCSVGSSTGCPSCTATSSGEARLIAAPGCYPTAAILALSPLIGAGLLAVPGPSGSAGATGPHPSRSSSTRRAGCPGPGGRRRSASTSAPWTRTSSPTGSSTTGTPPEMEQNLGAPVLFTPHLAPDGAGDPGHLLRPAGGPGREPAASPPATPWPSCTRPTTTSPSSWSPTIPRRPRPPADRTAPTSRSGSTNARGGCWPWPPSTT